MKIVDSAISMTAQHEFSKTTVQSGTSSFWQDFERFVRDQRNSNTPIDTQSISPLINSHQSVRFSATFVRIKTAPLQNTADSEAANSYLEKQKILVLDQIINVLFGQKMRLKAFDGSNQLGYGIPQGFDSTSFSEQFAQVLNNNRFYHEDEQLSFEAGGVFKTADGKEVNFSTGLNLSRDFATQNNINLATGEKLIDPLVINYDGPAASLTNTKFSFDLDANGQPEQVSFLNQGSGFLALDLNNDQKINSGLELFGAKTGNGFNELATYDQDHNGWIDEGDPVFNNLRIWTKDLQGNDQLFALGQKGIGAVYLGNVNAPFNYTNDSNQSLGSNQDIGLFAKEDGKVGTVQEIALTV